METLVYVWVSVCLSYWSDGTGPLTFLPPPHSQLRPTNGVNRFDSKVLSERVRFPGVAMVFLPRVYPVGIAGVRMAGCSRCAHGVDNRNFVVNDVVNRCYPSKPYGSSGAQAQQGLVSL